MIHHNLKQSFDVYDNGTKTGFVQYEMRDGRVCFLLTELSDRFRRPGYTASILGEVLDDLHHRRMEILPYCPLIRDFVWHHPAYLDPVPHDQLSRFRLTAGTDTTPADSTGAAPVVAEKP